MIIDEDESRKVRFIREERSEFYSLSIAESVEIVVERGSRKDGNINKCPRAKCPLQCPLDIGPRQNVPLTKCPRSKCPREIVLEENVLLVCRNESNVIY